MIQLTRTNPGQNMHRFYALQIAPTLFGDWALVAEWGRIGSSGRVQERVFDTEREAEADLTKRLRIKANRGYVRASWEKAA